MNWFRYALKLTFVSALASLVSIAITWQVIHFYAEKAMQTIFGEHAQKYEFSDFLFRLANVVNTINQGEPMPSSNAQNNPKDSMANPDGSQARDEAVPVFGESSEKAQGEQVLMTTEEFFKMKDLLTDEEKNKIFSLFLSKLSQEDIMLLSRIVEGGITTDEMKSIDEIARKHLNEEEYKEMMDIVLKYDK